MAPLELRLKQVEDAISMLEALPDKILMSPKTLDDSKRNTMAEQ
jgi:hypothetical protein